MAAMAARFEPLNVDCYGNVEPEEHRPTVNGRESRLSQISFTEVCKEAHSTLRKANQKYCGHGNKLRLSDEILKNMEESLALLNSKEICIGICGMHNSGKSTLINALLGDNLLPMNLANETSVKVKIQHDGNVHPQPCTPQTCVHNTDNQKCPKLLVSFPTSQEPYYVNGSNSISKELKKLNEEVRSCKQEVPSVVLFVNFPLLSTLSKGYTVCLADTPGFGEHAEVVECGAKESMRSSAAYIYLLEIGTVGSESNAKSLKYLSEVDENAFKDRLAFVIAKFDMHYCDAKHDFDDETNCAIGDEDCRREKVQSSVEDATGIKIDMEAIIPVSGRWALCSSKLQHMAVSHQHYGESYRKVLRSAKKYLVEYLERPHSSPCGQDEHTVDDSPSSIAEKLKHASGILSLVDRIKFLVGRNVEIMEAKLCTDYLRYTQDVANSLKKQYEQQQEEVSGAKEDYQQKNHKVEHILAQRGHLDQIRSVVLKEIGGKYDADVKSPECLERVKKEASELVTTFHDTCFKKCYLGDFGKAEMEEAMENFIGSATKALQQLFNAHSRFRSCDVAVRKYTNYVLCKCGILEERANSLIGSSCDEVNPDINTQDSADVPPLAPPNLEDIKKTCVIPDVKLSTLTWILNKLRKILDLKPMEDSYRMGELQTTFEKLTASVHKACDDYFECAKDTCVKYFMKEYDSSVSGRLRRFDTAFKVPIEQQNCCRQERIKDLRKTLHNLQQQLEELQRIKGNILRSYQAHKCGHEEQVDFP